MYVASQFALDSERALAMAEQIGVADFISTGENGIEVTYLPFNMVRLPDGRHALHSHLARINPHTLAPGPGMVVVHGPSQHISPDVLDEPGERVPTLDYLVIHLIGELIFHHDEDWKVQSLIELVARHEPTWRFDRFPKEKIHGMMKAIVGVEFVIDKVIGKAKFSQNLASDELASLATKLRVQGHSQETAELIEQLAIPYAKDREARVEQAKQIAARRKAKGQASSGS